MNAMPELARVECSECPIRHRAVCARCAPDELVRLEAMKFYREYKAGDTLAWSGEDMDFVASVVDGVASLSQTMEDGRRQMVGLLLPSDFLGRPGRRGVAYDVTAITDLTVCCFRKTPFEGLIAETPHVAQRLLEMTLDELDAAREWMLVLGRKTAREKIASLLAILARRGAPGRDKDIYFELPLSREAMADYLGLTLETASRQMTALRKDGIITAQGKRGITVPDLHALMDEAGDDSDGGVLI